MEGGAGINRWREGLASTDGGRSWHQQMEGGAASIDGGRGWHQQMEGGAGIWREGLAYGERGWHHQKRSRH